MNDAQTEWQTEASFFTPVMPLTSRYVQQKQWHCCTGEGWRGNECTSLWVSRRVEAFFVDVHNGCCNHAQ